MAPALAPLTVCRLAKAGEDDDEAFPPCCCCCCWRCWRCCRCLLRTSAASIVRWSGTITKSSWSGLDPADSLLPLATAANCCCCCCCCCCLTPTSAPAADNGAAAAAAGAGVMAGAMARAVVAGAPAGDVGSARLCEGCARAGEGLVGVACVGVVVGVAVAVEAPLLSAWLLLMNGWLKNASKSILSLESLFSRPSRRCARSLEMPPGSLVDRIEESRSQQGRRILCFALPPHFRLLLLLLLPY